MTEHPSLEQAAGILAEARSDPLRDLLRYWMAIHPRVALPARRHFDPAEVPMALGNLVLTDVEREPYRFRVRLMGTAVVSAFGRDFTGQYLDEVLPDVQASGIHADRVRVAESGLPIYHYGESTMPFRLDFAPIERVFLPFASDGERVDMILGMTLYLTKSAAQRRRPVRAALRL